MTINGWLQILFFFALVLAVTKPLGIFMARVFNRERTFLDPVVRPIERLIYRATGVKMIGALGKTQFMMEELPILTSQGGKWVTMPEKQQGN